MDLSIYYSYWQKYKDSLNLVKSIHNVDVFDIEETMSYIKRQGKGPHLVVEDPSIDTAGRSVDNIVDNTTSAILVLEKLKIRTDKATDRNTLLVNTFNVARDIQKQMLSDAESGCGFLRGLQYNKFSLDKVGPLGDSLYGWRLQFIIKSPLI